MWLTGGWDSRGAWNAAPPGLCGILAALSIAGAGSLWNHHDLWSGRIYSTVQTVALTRADVPVRSTTTFERALRRRVVRLARIKMLERRERELRKFLANSHSESPLFEDDSVSDAGAGLLVGPTIVTRDFLGDAMVRAIVRNASASRRMPLLIVHLNTAAGVHAAALALAALDVGESRRIELIVPTRATPTGVHWSAMPGF